MNSPVVNLRNQQEIHVERKSFDQYYDAYATRMSDIPVHNDFRQILDWVKNKPGYETGIMEIATVLAGDGSPTTDDVRRAVGVSVVLCSWPGAIGNIFFEVMTESGDAHPVENVPQDAMDGKAPYVLEATGEVIADLPARLVPRIRIADFQPSHDVSCFMK